MRNVESPYFSLWESEPQGEPIGMRVEEDGKSECRPVMGRIGVATSPHAKAGWLPSGVSSQESLVIRPLEGEQDDSIGRIVNRWRTLI